MSKVNSNVASKKKRCLHGQSRTKTYRIWGRMKARCYNKNNRKWPEYGGRGIKVCDSWLEFEGFHRDMGDRPEGLSIDRIDNSGNYEPGNCRWATEEEQQENKRRARWWFLDGERFSSARKAGLHYGVALSTIWNWCNGAKAGCYSVLKYAD